MAVNPISDILLWNFKQDFLHVPRQHLSRFAHLCRQEEITTENQFDDILPQVDGVDYDPNQENLKFRPLPILQFDSERVGYQRYAHTWNYAIATEDLNRFKPAFRMELAMLARESWERFTDRLLANTAPTGARLTVPKGADAGNIGTASLTSTKLPAKYRYVSTKLTGSTNTFDTMNLQFLKDLNKTVFASEIEGKLPVLVASPRQILNLLNIEQIINADYNTVLALTRGDVNSFMGFQFIKTWAVGTETISGKAITAGNDPNPAAAASSTQAAGARTTRFKTNTRELVNFITTGNAASGESSIATVASGADVELDKILICDPMKAFSCGIYPQAGYMNVWQNPNKSGAYEYYFKNVMSWRRTQNEFVRVGYAASEASDTDAPIRKAGTQATDYYTNAAGNAVWDFANAV